MHYCCSYHNLMCLFFYSLRENKFLFPILDLQGWAIVASGDPLEPCFCSWATRRIFFIRSICWAPWISQFESTGLPSMFLRAQPCAVSVCPKFSPLQVLLVAPLAVIMVEVIMVEVTTIKTMPLQSLFCSLHKLTPENNKNFITWLQEAWRVE